ncbi:uncharacterized protein LOC126882493 [Diabrotica virgifera virgifera]|uniref:DNA-directed DNA polymerase n=1 Tax=Diabrotica virgifera virgifera TaxID=50390 RepID=A0ABM5JZQ3_DIAVI|nr:uncharacterized protein LOC126882493 [Diabrotica virgifera virgifera]
MGMLKVNTTFCGEFIKKAEEVENLERKYFNTKNEVIDVTTDLNYWFEVYVKNIVLTDLSEFEESQSGWALNQIISLEININKFEMAKGASSYIQLHPKVTKKRACINVKNNDQACFAWAIVSALYSVNINTNKTTSYPHYTTVLNLKGLTFPVTLNQISLFEKNNENISVNVFELNVKDELFNFSVLPVRLTKQKREKHVNLLIVQNKYYFNNEVDNVGPWSGGRDEDLIHFHYIWIKDLGKLVKSQLSKHNGKKYICDRCLNYFYTKEKLDAHIIYCEKIDDCKISFTKEPYVKFKNFVYKEKLPFLVYADFESLLVPLRASHSTPSTTSTHPYQRHTAYSAGLYFKCNYVDNFSFYKSHVGLDCMSWFSHEIDNLAQFIHSKLINIQPMNVEVSLKDATERCHICNRKFLEKDRIVRDHCHLTGNFRGFAHNGCNLNYKKAFVVPIAFHNMSGYDSHFIIKDLAKMYDISILPVNKEKYISFTVYHKKTNIRFRFIDTFRFMGSSLDSLVSTLKPENFGILRKQFPNLDDETFKLLTKKGVFFYDYLDKIERLDETKLPNKEKFYNKLNDEHISDSNYAHAKLVWEKFNMKTLWDYSNLYMKTDILLLAVVFETFRDTCFKTYGLDPGHYYTIPGFTWDAMLKYTGCHLETIQDVDMLLFYERGIRGGISQCCNRMGEANNKYMMNYDPSKPSKYLMYLDVNNLYGWAMSEPLPYGGFHWDDTNIDVMSIPDDAKEGYILEVDLSYPENLHDYHKDLPFCVEHCKPPGSKQSKLLSTLYNKTNYVIHYRNLKQAISHGLVLTKIHKVLRFKQMTWLKGYIALNTQLRAQAKTSFEKNLYKLMNNAVFGKTMENQRKHRLVKLVNKWEGRVGARNLIASPKFHSRVIFDQSLMAVELKKAEIIFNKPLYVGMAILELSKTCIYEFHYDYMLQKFPLNQNKLLYIDTDGLIYETECNDIYEEMIKPDIHRFDTSDYPPNNPWNIPLVNKKVPGLMKDENNSKIMTHFVGLRSKQYTYKVAGEKDVKKSKGVKMNVVKMKINFDDYLNCLKSFRETAETKSLFYATQRCIQSKLHEVYSIEQTKIALNPFDDKRHLLSNTFDTLPWGHYSITHR